MRIIGQVAGHEINLEIEDVLDKINKTGMDRFQDCCKAKATNALLQS